MIQKKSLIIATVVFLLAAVCLSGCIDGNGNNTTNNTTVPEPTETKKPEPTETKKPEPTETKKPEPTETNESKPNKDSVSITSHSPKFTSKSFLKLDNTRKFYTSSVNVEKGEGIHIRNMDTKLNSKMLIHSADGVFEDQRLNPNYSLYIQFKEPGIYTIELYSYDKTKSEGKLTPFGSSPSTLKVNVT